MGPRARARQRRRREEAWGKTVDSNNIQKILKFLFLVIVTFKISLVEEKMMKRKNPKIQKNIHISS